MKRKNYFDGKVVMFVMKKCIDPENRKVRDRIH